MTHISNPITQPSQTGLDKYGYNSIARHTFMGVFMGVVIFLGAGTLEWGWGWIAAITNFVGWLLMSLILVAANPEILNQRGKRGTSYTGTKRWDWIILTLYGVLVFVQPFIGGLDYRYGWFASGSPALKLFGNVVMLAGYLLLTWAMAVNRHFEGTVRIQTQRDHSVISSGPYHYVRHPGYSGVLLMFIGMALALGGIAIWLPTIAGIVLFVVRTSLEDATLQQELPGYAEFARQTRYRLLPGVW